MKRVLMLSLLLPFIFLFQNCEKAVKFGNSSVDKVSAKGTSSSLQPVKSDVDDSDASDHIVPQPNNDGNDNHDNDDSEHHDQQSEEVQSGPMDHVCILEGEGSSVKLGLVEDGIDGQNSAAQALCMSVHACVDLAAKAFHVKAAESRGYCKSLAQGDDELRAITDAEMAKMIADILKH